MGVSNIILSGYSPSPIDQLGYERKDFHKVALGAEKMVPWEQVKTLAAAIKKVKKDGYHVVAIELDKKATPLFEFKSTKKPLAIILGNEVKGISPQMLKQCDEIVEIPMQGKKESLNVSVAAGVALFTLLR